MPIDGIATYTVAYRRNQNYHQANGTTPVTQRWPVTRSRALRAAVLRTLALSTPGTRAYQWVRVNPPVPLAT